MSRLKYRIKLLAEQSQEIKIDLNNINERLFLYHQHNENNRNDIELLMDQRKQLLKEKKALLHESKVLKSQIKEQKYVMPKKNKVL